jgi:hypothetical protein
LLRRPRADIRGPLIGQFESAEVETELGFAELFEVKINDCPIRRHREGFLLATEIAARRAMSPKDAAISLQHGQARIALCGQKTAFWQRHESRRSAVALSALCLYCAPWSETSLIPGQDWGVATCYWIGTARKERLSIRGPPTGKLENSAQRLAPERSGTD